MVWPFTGCSCGRERKDESLVDEYDSSDDEDGYRSVKECKNSEQNQYGSGRSRKKKDETKGDPRIWEAAWWWETGRRGDGTIITDEPINQYPAFYQEVHGAGQNDN
eukprot:CAMPEP_0118923732 /NCGR_PEP_ID=MMETSP1169-20130426/2153_1 /TAXON_ID=36882 /ORGANISM="Pyramimonas obovata, Strain CCMP722" /LENGTH=105 /DNA_ID=CAMNT_0006864763 /DNA_START=229 /DNA_END=546 /DNA_ORIENTATION=-